MTSRLPGEGPPDLAAPAAAESVTVVRGKLRCQGVRIGRVAVYEFDIPSGVYVRPEATRRQRVFLLLDESAQLNQRVVFKPNRAGWWYVDMVEFEEQGDAIRVTDQYVDIIVGPPGYPYRVLDLHELAEALATGVLKDDQVVRVLVATQAFMERHLQGPNHDGPDWPDFPPAALGPVRAVEIMGR